MHDCQWHFTWGYIFDLNLENVIRIKRFKLLHKIA